PPRLAHHLAAVIEQRGARRGALIDRPRPARRSLIGHLAIVTRRRGARQPNAGRPGYNAAVPNPQSGTILGAYRVEGTIGSGSMGEVFRGIDTGLNRRVAIKLLSEKHRDNPELRQRF